MVPAQAGNAREYAHKEEQGCYTGIFASCTVFACYRAVG